MRNDVHQLRPARRGQSQPERPPVLARAAFQQAALHHPLGEHRDRGPLDQQMVRQGGGRDPLVAAPLADSQHQAELRLRHAQRGEVLVKDGRHAGPDPHQSRAKVGSQQVVLHI